MTKSSDSQLQSASGSFAEVQPAPARNGEPRPAHVYIIWWGTTGGENRVVGFARDLADAMKTMSVLAPDATASNDEIRRDWPCMGATEILRTWFDKTARVTRWLRATPTFHALDSKNLRLNASSANPQI